MKKYSFTTEQTSTGYSAYYQHADGSIVATTGASINELSTNALEALNLFLEHNNQPIAALEHIYIDLAKQPND